MLERNAADLRRAKTVSFSFEVNEALMQLTEFAEVTAFTTGVGAEILIQIHGTTSYGVTQ